MADSVATQDRSVSRGRDAFQSSGRGGIGNIRRSSISTDTRPTDGPDDFSPTRGREPAVNADRQVFSVGRGGAGNIRSPSRDIGPDHPQTASILSDHAAANADYERQVRKLHAEANPVHSSGRGGLGNISASRSRSKGPSPALHSTGRGGAGNIQYGDGLNADILDQEERRKHAHGEGMHSTGRGGVANLTSSRGPSLEIHGHHAAEFESSGRGGAGNIRSRSASRDPSGRTPSREKHGIAALWNKVSHPQYNSRLSDQSIHSLHSDAAGQDGGTLSPRND